MITGLSIDPGAKAGWALSHDGAIVASGLVRLDLGHRIRVFSDLSWLVCEGQQLYPHDVQHFGPVKAAARANDLITCGQRAGLLCGMAAPGTPITWVLPHAWKGSVDKDTHNLRVLKRLTEAEKALLDGILPSLVNNVIDAIGLNLWKSGRYRP